MSKIEAAASLFGSSDSGSDFLTASDGANSAADSPSGAAESGKDGKELHGHEQDPSSLFDDAVASNTGDLASSLFVDQGTEAVPSLFDGPVEQAFGEQAHAATENELNAYGYDQGSYSNGNYETTNGPYDYQAGGWYDEHGQWQAANAGGSYDQYGQWQATNNAYDSYTPQHDANGYDYAAGHSTYGVAPTNSYSAPAPSQAYDYPTSNSYTPAASSNPSQSQYDPYAPPVPSASTQTVTSSATSTSIYNPYKPTSTTSSQTAPTTQYAPAQPSYDAYAAQASTHAPGPPSALMSSSSFKPPAATAATSKSPASPYRPSTFDAYDPPLPTVKSKRSMTASTLKSPTNAFSPVSPLPSSNNSQSLPRSESVPVSGLPPLPSRPPLQQTKPPVPFNTASSTEIFRSRSPYDPPMLNDRNSNAIARAASPSRASASSAYFSPPPANATSSNGFQRSASSYDPPLPSRFPNQVPPRRQARPHPQLEENAARRTPQPQENYPVNEFASASAASVSEAGRSSNDVVEGWDPESGDVGYREHISGTDVQPPRGSTKTGSRTGSPRLPSSPPKAHIHFLSETRRTSSPEVVPRSGGSQRTSSPLSDSGRSYTGSVGRMSPLHSFHNRNGTVAVGQSFHALDDAKPYYAEAYDAVGQNLFERTSSPGAQSTGSPGAYGLPRPAYQHQSNDENVIDLASDTSSYGKPGSPPVSSRTNTATYDSYVPSPSQSISPTGYAAPPSSSGASTDPYAPPVGDSVNAGRARSVSNMSFSTTSTTNSYSPYAPVAPQHMRRDSSPTNTYSVPPPGSSFAPYVNGRARTSLESPSSPPPITGPYAPSPSLLGTNDPLGRAKARVPVITFGFGGKLVTCFHTSPTYETGFDVALTSRKCTDVHIRILHKVIPESALEISSAQYPGPLLGDPGSPVSTLMKTATAASAKKTKKAKVMRYLEDRADEMEKGLAYLADGSMEKRRAEGKFTLVRLLRALVEYDGQLHSNQANETAVRAALLPRLSDSSDSTGTNVYLNAPTGAALASGEFASGAGSEHPLAEYAVRPSALSMLQDFLLRGEKRKAFHYALDERMWAHAMVISSSVDKEAFKEVVTEFIRAELGVKAGGTTNGLESLRLAYSLYSGQSSTAVQHLFPTKNLQAGPMLTLQPPTPMNHMTPLSPNFPSPAQASNIPADVLSQWRDYAVMLFSGQMGSDCSASLTTLGDYLLANNWIEAAHCCYLLSPLTSPVSGVGAPSVRVVLVGSESPHRNTSFSTDPDAFVLSEILEYALSLHTLPKGQEAFGGFPHLQVYRLIRAMQYADLGHVALAKRYLDAISGCAIRASPFLTPQFSDLVRDFYGRINGESQLEKSGSWITSKISKPSLNGIGDWIGGSLSKFVAGDEPSSPVGKEASLSNNPAYAGAFQNFSNISSADTSRGPSPAPSVSQSAGYGRPSMSMDRSVSGNSYAPYGRSPSSSFDYDRGSMRGTPPPPRMSTDSYAPSTNHLKSSLNDSGAPAANGHSLNEAESKQSGGWWSSAYGDGSGPTPTAASFLSVEAASSTTAESSGFISLMDSYPSYTPSPSATTFSSARREEAADDFDDDLGLGNSSRKKKSDDNAGKGEETEVVEKKEVPTKPNINPTPSSSSSGSWLGRLFSRAPSTSSSPGPVKANLGEETSFYYDKESKRWVNKKAGAEPEKPKAAPPPPRAQTASPSRAMGNVSLGPPPASPLPSPHRPFSAMDSGSVGGPPPIGQPKGPIQRVRSNLGQEGGKDASVPPVPPMPAAVASLTAAPPTGRPKSAAKKSVRSRYVDVLQQP